ncbi:MAG TPA: hypothetical protein VFI13_00315 [Gemmatimonadales bacterium]|nr:hypothetical protein [Gemmatimonadales bacterium]
MNGCPVTYRVDEEGRILAVGQAWDDFARANQAPGLTAREVIGRSIWDAMSDPTTREIYRRLVDRVHEGVPPVRFTFRCDAPARRRLLQMTITAGPDGTTDFETLPISCVDRGPVALLDVAAPRSGELLRMCSWCKRIPLDGDWVEVEEAARRSAIFHGGVPPAITHGICPACEALVFGLSEAPHPAEATVAMFGAYP